MARPTTPPPTPWPICSASWTASATSTTSDVPTGPCTAPPLLRHYRVRFDTVYQFSKVTLRHGGIVHHLGVGNTRRGVKILLLIDEKRVTVTDLDTDEVLSEHDIDDAHNHWRNRLRESGRWPE